MIVIFRCRSSSSADETESSGKFWKRISDSHGINKLCRQVARFFTLYAETLISEINVNFEVSAVPEPATWAMMIAGFGLAGAALRRRSKAAVAA